MSDAGLCGDGTLIPHLLLRQPFSSSTFKYSWLTSNLGVFRISKNIASVTTDVHPKIAQLTCPDTKTDLQLVAKLAHARYGDHNGLRRRIAKLCLKMADGLLKPFLELNLRCPTK
jgi:hypothetical protein